MTSTTSSLKVIRQLDADSASECFLASVPGFEAPQCLRVLRAEVATDEAHVERFLAQVRALQGLEHEGLLKVHSCGRMKDGRVYALTQFAEGETLVSRTALEVPQLVELGFPIAQLLETAHQQGLRLGNITAKAVLLTEKGAQLDAAQLAWELPEGSQPADEVRALATVLLQCSLPGDEKAPFDSAVRRTLVAGATAAQLREALWALRARWAADTRVSGAAAHEAPSATIEEPDLSGTSLGNYALVRILGEGAMGRVYLSRHARIGRMSALKLLKSEHARNKDLVQRFIQEATAVNAARNEHIVEVYDFGEELSADGTVRAFCVMELLEGRPLSEAMGKGEVQRAVRICQAVARALSAAHQVGIVHRDIKPENIYLHRKGSEAEFVKVLDFGVAKLLKPIGDIPKSGTQAGIVIGTPEYMAPEQAMGLPSDLRVDVYALGLVLYELLSGQQPFQGATFGQLVVELTTKPPPPLPARTGCGDNLPPGLVQIILKCLQKAPEDRYASAEELAAALEPFAYSGRTVVDQRIPGAQEPEALPALPKSRAPRFVLGGVALAAAGLALAILQPWAAPPAAPPVAVVEPAVAAAPKVSPPAPAPAPLPQIVSAKLETRPPGATVTRLDTAAVLGATPLTVRFDRDEGEVTLRFALSGHQNEERAVSRSSDSTLSIDLAEVVAEKPKFDPAKKKPAKKVSNNATVDPFDN